MAKYVIDRDYDGWWMAYKKVFGLWGIITYVSGTAAYTPEECEQKLRKILKGKPIYKELEIK